VTGDDDSTPAEENHNESDGIPADDTAPNEKKKSQATRLVDLVLDRYDLGVSPEGQAFATPKKGAPLVKLLTGSKSSLRTELANLYFEENGTAASAQPLADALAVVEGRAQRLDPTELHLRVAQHSDFLVVDLGDATGRSVVLGSGGWGIADDAPVRFRRTALTGALPVPTRGGDLGALWSLLNVAENYRPVLAAVLVSALMPTIPHPIVVLTGEQGTGKSSATRMVAAALDPSPVQLRKPPKDLEAWTTAATGSWVVALDNISAIPAHISDALCRACTGDGDVRRKLYSDNDLHVTAFKRVVFLNGIDLGVIVEDLADRLVTIGLERIPDENRRRRR